MSASAQPARRFPRSDLAALTIAGLSLLVQRADARSTPYSQSEISRREAQNVDELLSAPSTRGLYSLAARGWIEATYFVGRPGSKVLAYAVFEGPSMTAAIVSGTGVVELSKDALLAAAEHYIRSPETVSEAIASAAMRRGLDAFHRNYERHRRWRRGDQLSPSELDLFLTDHLEVHYFGYGKRLWSDVQRYRAGKYESSQQPRESNEAAELLLAELARLGELSEAWDVATTAIRLRGLVASARGSLIDFPPYAKYLAEVEKLEAEAPRLLDGSGRTDAPFATTGSSLAEPAPEFVDPPPRPTTSSAHDAIRVGNAEEVWAHVYYRTGDINNMGSGGPWLHAALIAEAEERGRRIRAYLESHPELYAHIQDRVEVVNREDFLRLFPTSTSSARVSEAKRELERQTIELGLREEFQSTAFVAMIDMLIERGADVDQVCLGSSALPRALSLLNVSAARTLVRAGAGIDSGRTPDLESAASLGDLELFTLLLDRGATATPRTLSIAIGFDRLDFARALLTRGMLPEQLTEPLIEAAKEENEKAFLLLLAQGADPNAQIEREGSAIHVAGVAGSQVMLSILLASGVDLNKRRDGDGATCLSLAIENGHDEVARLLVDRGADPRADAVLRAAAAYGDVPLVEWLIDLGANPKETAVIEAAVAAAAVPPQEPNSMLVGRAGGRAHLYSESVELDSLTMDPWCAGSYGPAHIRRLRERIDRSGAPLVYVQRSSGRVLVGNDTIRALRDLGWETCEAVLLDLDNSETATIAWTLDSSIADGRSADELLLDLVSEGRLGGVGGRMHLARLASTENRLKMLDLLVSHGARPGPAGLLLAARSTNLPLMRFLLVQGVDPSYREFENQTALRIAAAADWRSGTELLFEFGADPNAHGGQHLLCDAALAEDRSRIQYLVGRGAALDGSDGHVPLVHVIQSSDGRRNTNSAYYLVSEGARVNVKDGDGRTPLGEAEKLSPYSLRKSMETMLADMGSRQQQ